MNPAKSALLGALLAALVIPAVSTLNTVARAGELADAKLPDTPFRKITKGH